MFKSLKTPVILIFALTFLVLLVLAGTLFSKYYTTYKQYQTVQKTLPLSTQIQSLIDTLAQERDLHDLKYANAHLKAPELARLQQQLKTARLKTDTLLYDQQLIHTLETHSPEANFLANQLRKLPKLRQTQHSFEAYNQLIYQLIYFNDQLLERTLLPLSNPALMFDLNNLITLIQLSEYAGEERGQMMQVLLSQTLDTDHYLQLNGLQLLQQQILNNLKTSITTQQNMIINSEAEDMEFITHLLQSLKAPKYKQLLQVRQQMRDQFKLQQQLLQLFSVMGYNGFIHHFKNAVLRQQMSAYLQAKQDALKLQKILASLNTLPLTPKQQSALQTLKQTLNQYVHNLQSLPDLIHKGFSPQAIDQQVKVNESSAVAALHVLQKFDSSISPAIWWQEATLRIHNIQQAQNFFQQDILQETTDMQEELQQQALLLFAALLLLILLSSLLMRYIFRRIQQITTFSETLNTLSLTQQFKQLPINGQDEVASLTRSFNHLIQEREQYEHELWERSNLDPLTQLPNRAYLLELMTLFIKEHQRHQHKLGLLFIDLDGFKNINDTKGHHIGDQLLQNVAECLTSCIRSSDIAARLGGDEFVILVTRFKNRADLEKVAQAVIATLSKPITLNPKLTVNISASVGITVYPEDATDTSTLLINADLAMYEAKAQGKNRYAFYHASLAQNLTTEQQISDALIQAVESGHPETHGFFLTYQPIVDTHQKVEHFEALIRWIHPELGFLPPDKFIEIAERTQTIIPLGQWIIREASQQLKQWQQRFPKHAFHISINLSPVQAKEGFASVHQQLDALKQQNFPVERLHFEITESLLMQNNQEIRTGIETLKNYGGKVYLDDFGTGYSSLSYLKLFSMDVLKIDRSFIIDLMHDKQDQELVKTILSIAKVLNMQVVAEGVEEEAQFEYLKAHGCDLIQGYWISKPLKGDEATEFLQKHLDRE